MSDSAARPRIPVASPGAENARFGAALAQAAQRVLNGGHYVLGPEVAAFESEIAASIGAAFAVGVGSGTDALTLALAGAGIGPGDEVITVSHSALATVAGIVASGATPVLAEIDPRTLTISAEAAAAASGRRTRAIVPVHLYGGAADLGALRRLADDRGLLLIEDCAQAQGTLYEGEHVGARADAATFSFYPTKNLGALGDGGAVTTSSAELAGRVRSLRQYGWDDDRISRERGWNSRLDELQAAMLRVKLARLGELVAERRAIASAYGAGIGMPLVRLPEALERSEHSFHLYVVRVGDGRRDELAAHLAGLGVGTAIHYPVPTHLQPGYAKQLIRGPLPETEAAANEVLTLPLYPGLGPDEVARVIAGVNSFA